MKWIMQYEHANAEELKELAEKGAAEMAEKQENWEEEKENMKRELNALRERITSAANETDLNETFRAQISSLNEENSYLKAQNRERDRELADQGDKVERLSTRIEQLEKERAAFIQQQTFSDDVIRELNRRLNIKLEASASSEAETIKLRQRNQQASQLSKQLQEVVEQNDELRAEMEQLSSALSSATTFIKDTTENYAALRRQLLESDHIIERLTNDNELLIKKLDDERAAVDKLESGDESSIQHYENLLRDRDEQIEVLKQKFDMLQIELQEFRAQSMLESNAEREEEMEKLRTELVEATKTARRLFGGTASNATDESTAQLRRRVLELDKTVEALQCKIREHEKQAVEFARDLEVKDAENLKANAELKKLRVAIFGSAEVEISRLEKQLNFREQQIEKLAARCSLLQIELGNVNANYQNPMISVADTNPVKTSPTKPILLNRELEANENELIPKTSAKKEEMTIQAPTEPSIKSEGNSKISKIDRSSEQHGKKKEEHEECLGSWEASAMIISSLNQELMLLMQELDEKEQQLRLMERSTRVAVSSLNELKIRYFNLQKDISEYDSIRGNKANEELQEKIERYETEIEEYQKLASSLRLNGKAVERKLEEMNRQVVAERLRNLQLVRKLQIVERNRDDEDAKYVKLEKSCQEQQLLHAKQLRVANYELDLTAIEIARLQTILLHSVPRTDYDELLERHKQLLASDDNCKVHLVKTNKMEKEYLSINLLKEMSDETGIAELAADNTHLKEVINVLTSQNKYWQAEVEKIRAQNKEMKHFLEDIESESQVKSLLVALERRFIEALFEREQVSQNKTLVSQQFLDLQNEFARKRKSWANEKKKLVQVIRSQQILLHRIRSNSMELLTVQQMLQYKEKVAEANANYVKSEQYKEEIERLKEELELQIRNAEALKKSYELLHGNDYNVLNLQKSLQANQLNLLNTSKRLENAQLQIQKRDMEIQKLEGTVSSLKEEIQHLFAATFNITDFDGENGETHEQHSSATDTLIAQKNELLEPEKRSTKLDIQDIDDEHDDVEEEDLDFTGKIDETPTYFIDTRSNTKLSTVVEPRVIETPQNIPAITKEYEEKLSHIRETAELCIENYKEQLRYKEQVIKKYKVLLQSMQNERDLERGINGLSLSADEFGKKKLRTSTEILFQNSGVEDEAKDLEIIKLKNEIHHFTEANRRLTDELVKIQRHTNADASTQTDIPEKKEEMEKGISDEINGKDSGSEVFKENEEFGKIVPGSEPTHIQTPSPLPPPSQPRTRTTPIKLTEESDDTLVEALRREESTTMLLRMEIRKLKQRVATMNIRNKELEQACEKIRSDALSQIERNYAPNNGDASEATITRLQQELSVIKKETESQKGLIREQKQIIEQLQGTNRKEFIQNTKAEVAKWHERKVREGNIDALRKKLKETEKREQEMREKVEKRDRRIEQLHRIEASRTGEFERLRGVLKKLKEANEMYSLQQERANDFSKNWEETNRFLSQRIAELEKENEELLMNKTRKETAISSGGKNDVTELVVAKTSVIVSEEQLHCLTAKAEQFDELMRRLQQLEKEGEAYQEKIEALTEKLNTRKYDCGAVAVLRDKLMAKEKIIEQQQQRIEQLEREKWQNLL